MTAVYAPFMGTCVKCRRDDRYLIWRHTPKGEAQIATCVDGNACARACWSRRERNRKALETEGGEHE